MDTSPVQKQAAIELPCSPALAGPPLITITNQYLMRQALNQLNIEAELCITMKKKMLYSSSKLES